MMKNLRFFLCITALLISITAAFATKRSNQKKSQNGVEWHAVTDDMSNYHWTTVQPSTGISPSDYTCTANTNDGVYCDVVVFDGYIPQNNTPISINHVGLQGTNEAWYLSNSY